MNRIFSFCVTALTVCSMARASELEKQWAVFPFQALPTLSRDEGIPPFIKSLQRLGPMSAARLSQNIFDTKNGYANFILPDDSFLEIVLWNSANHTGYIVANRSRMDEQSFKVWRFQSGTSPYTIPSPFVVSVQEQARAYRHLTGQPMPAGTKIKWFFPRYGTVVTAAFEPENKSLLKLCKAISNVDYNCENRLDIAKFRWNGSSFIKTSLY